MAAPTPSIVNSAIQTSDILGSGTDPASPATASPAANNSPAATTPAGSLTISDLPVSISNVISTDFSPILSTTGTISSPEPLTTLLPSTPTTPISPTLILTSSSSSLTPIPTTPQTSTFSNITPTPSTSTSLFESTSSSSSVSLSGTASIGSTTIVTVVSGTTVTSVLPTTLVNSPSADVVSRRTAAFAGAATGFVVLFLIALGLVFWYRRHKLRKVLESTGKKKEGRGLLDGEEFDDDERNLSNSMQSYHYPTPVFDSHCSSASLNLMKSRTSETGSIFREEVWPPPGFIDPILKQNSDVGLSCIVDNVMGPSSDQLAGPSAGPQELHQPDESSLSAFSSTSTSSLITPARPVSSSSSIYRTVASASSNISLPPPSARSSVNFQPRKSSPLTRASMSDPKLWLTRNVRQSAIP